jgi:hypothetical protein
MDHVSVIPVENVIPGRLWTMLTGSNVENSVLGGKKTIAEYAVGTVTELLMETMEYTHLRLNEN